MGTNVLLKIEEATCLDVHQTVYASLQKKPSVAQVTPNNGLLSSGLAPPRWRGSRRWPAPGARPTEREGATHDGKAGQRTGGRDAGGSGEQQVAAWRRSQSSHADKNLAVAGRAWRTSPALRQPPPPLSVAAGVRACPLPRQHAASHPTASQGAPSLPLPSAGQRPWLSWGTLPRPWSSCRRTSRPATPSSLSTTGGTQVETHSGGGRRPHTPGEEKNATVPARSMGHAHRIWPPPSGEE
jgi:hypothetical protein